MKMQILVGTSILLSLVGVYSMGATEIKLNPKMNYNSDCNDGAILTGKEMSDGKLATDKPTYVMIYSNQCFNSKRQARRTAELYQKYQKTVKFILIDLDSKKSEEQNEIMKKHYKGYIPHVIVFDKNGKALYDQAGEVDSKVIEQNIKKAMETGEKRKK